MRRVTSGLLLLMAACQCGPDVPEPGELPPVAGERYLDIKDLSEEELQARLEFEQLIRERLATDDFFYHQFHRYLSRDFRTAYLAALEEERVARFGPELLDLQERQELLDAYRHLLDPQEVEAYFRLPDLEACRLFLKERASFGTGSPGDGQ
jgi:hypothetical protein